MAFSPKILSSLILALFCHFLSSQEKEAGPIISDYGKVWNIDTPDYLTDSTKFYKAVFDIMDSPESHQQLNPAIETVARYLNMHARAGVPITHIQAAMVIHNKASKDVMSDDAYGARYGMNNPNSDLLNQLSKAGVEIVFCGQSSLSRDIPRNSLIPSVQVALSAMTALIQLQDDGYRLIKF